MSNTTKPKYWVGEPQLACDMCNTKFVDEFSDANILGGTWGCVCPRCAKRYGVSYGMGRGQRYTKQPDGKWMKTKG